MSAADRIEAPLLPCPFCGSAAKLVESPRSDMPGRTVWCPSCTNEDRCWAASGQTWYAHKEDAIRDWNTRTPSPEAVSAADRIEAERILACFDLLAEAIEAAAQAPMDDTYRDEHVYRKIQKARDALLARTKDAGVV